MKNHLKLCLLCLATGIFAHTAAIAQNAPGEDPIIYTKQTKFDARPGTTNAPSTGLDPLFGMQGWLQARVTRYEARAYSDQYGSVLTENDAVTTASAQGLKKVCVQEVGSGTADNSSFNRYGPKGAAQVVVLKGDLVNICK